MRLALWFFLLGLLAAQTSRLLAQQYVEAAIPRAADGALGDQFGIRVALSESTLAVGSWFDDGACFDWVDCNSGSVYVFERDFGGQDRWGQAAHLRAADESYRAYFGYTVDIDGDTITVGAYADNELAEASGAAYIFERIDGTWVEEKKLLPFASDPYLLLFGTAVALSGDVLVVGSPGDAHLCPSTPQYCLAGSAYVFERHHGGPNSWGGVKWLIPSDPQQGHVFGHSVAIDGDTIVVSSYGDTKAAGALYVFERDSGGSDNWGQAAKLVTSDRASGDLLGRWPDTIAIDGDTIVAGAPLDDDAGTRTGSAYIFQRSGGIWTQVQKLVASDATADRAFGASTSIHGHQVVVGSTWLPDNTGYAYIFHRSMGAWREVAQLRPSDALGGDWGFGGSVDVSSGTVVVGAFLADQACPEDPSCDAGASYVYINPNHIFSDGFESGDTSAWTTVVP